MKKIINGRKYDTDTAKVCGFMSKGYDTRDYSCYEETLYQKKNGEFFLYGEGGPSSKYASALDAHNYIGSCRIIPLSEFDAKRWAEEWLTVEDYEEIFGEVEE